MGLAVETSGYVANDGGGGAEVKHAVIDAGTTGDTTIVDAVSGKKIRVLDVVMLAAGTVTVRFESGAGGTALTGQMTFIQGRQLAPGYNPHGHFETAAGALLNLELSADVSVDGYLKYILV